MANLKEKCMSQDDGIMSFYDGLILNEISNDPSASGHILQLDDFIKES